MLMNIREIRATERLVADAHAKLHAAVSRNDMRTVVGIIWSLSGLVNVKSGRIVGLPAHAPEFEPIRVSDAQVAAIAAGLRRKELE